MKHFAVRHRYLYGLAVLVALALSSGAGFKWY